jgi:hypothetical protein
MDFWTMIVILVLIGVISDIYKSRYKKDTDETEKSHENDSELLSGLKDRVANLETIILEKERDKRFAELEKR